MGASAPTEASTLQRTASVGGQARNVAPRDRAPLLARPAVRAAWAVLAVTVTLNVAAAAPPNHVPGSLIPLHGPIGTLGSLAMIAATSLVLALLVRKGSVQPESARPSAGTAYGPALSSG